MATIDPNQTYDIVHTLTFSAASGDCPIRLYRGSLSATSGTVYYRAGTSGDWTSLSVSGTSTTFPITSTTMQVAHNWNKSGDNYMTPTFRGATNTIFWARARVASTEEPANDESVDIQVTATIGATTS